MLSCTYRFLFLLVAASTFHDALSSVEGRPASHTVSAAAAAAATASPTVDLGYEVYSGLFDQELGLNTFLGIRYAAPPTGSNRFQPPHVPGRNRSRTIPATEFPPRCPQNDHAPYKGNTCPGLRHATTLPTACAKSEYFQNSISGDEDCLFLDVYAPVGATKLPVLVYIHGGGYGGQDAEGQNGASLVYANGNAFVAVVIQYRLGAFGFLSSPEVNRLGTINAGLLDQHFALEWAQKYIHLFGGDPARVTIAGESAGAGSVMLQVMWEAGSLGTSLFQNAIAASPYLPMQHNYDDGLPTERYHQFASHVGCGNGQRNGTFSTIFACLQAKDSQILQQANAIVSGAGLYGTWSFVPVTDGKYVQELPSEQLASGEVNGLRLLAGNVANEGPPFTPQNITTPSAFTALTHRLFPKFTPSQFSQLEHLYAIPPSTPPTRYATTGTHPPSALSQGSFATGQQQRANTLYGETTLYCPAYFLAEAFSSVSTPSTPPVGKKAWKYEYSVPPGAHGMDLSAYFGGGEEEISLEFILAVQRIWGNFTVYDDPSPALLGEYFPASTNGTSMNGTVTLPQFPATLNLNTTGGIPTEYMYQSPGLNISVPIHADPPALNKTRPRLRNSFSIEDANSWEGGRGKRCEFWRGVGGSVPE